MKSLNTILFAVAALLSFILMLLPGVSDRVLLTLGVNMSATMSALFFVSFAFFCSALTENAFK